MLRFVSRRRNTSIVAVGDARVESLACHTCDSPLTPPSVGQRRSYCSQASFNNDLGLIDVVGPELGHRGATLSQLWGREPGSACSMRLQQALM